MRRLAALPAPQRLLAGLTLAASLLADRPVPAQDSPHPPPESLDAQGSPLPRGAFLRLGTIRFRHSSAASNVAFLGPGAVVALLPDKVLSVLDWPSGKRRYRLVADGEAVTAVAGDAGGKRIAFATVGGKVTLLGAALGKREGDLPLVGYVTHALEFSPGGGEVACGGSDGAVHVRSVESGAEARVLQVGAGEVTSVDWRGERIAAVTDSGEFRVWRVDGSAVAAGKAAAGSRIIRLSQDGKGAFTCSGGAGVECWRFGDVVERSLLEGGVGGVRCLAVSPDGGALAAAGASGDVRVWNLADRVTRFTVTAHFGAATGVAWAADGRSLATVGEDRRLRMLDAATGADLAPAPGHVETVTCLALSPDGKRIATGGLDGQAFLWDASSGRFLGAAPRRTEAVHALCWDPRGGPLAIGWGRKVTLVSPETLAAVCDIDAGAGRVRAMAWLPGGGVLAGGSDTVFRSLDPATGKLLREYRGHDGMVRSLAVDPAARWIVSTGADGKIGLWKADDAAVTWLVAEGKSVTCAAVSRDGTRFATGGKDACVRIWEAPSGKLLSTIRGFDGELTGVAFSPDASLVAGSAAGNSVRVCRPEGAEVVVFHGTGGETRGVCWGPDAETIYTAMFDTTVLGWRIPRR